MPQINSGMTRYNSEESSNEPSNEDGEHNDITNYIIILYPFLYVIISEYFITDIFFQCLL